MIQEEALERPQAQDAIVDFLRRIYELRQARGPAPAAGSLTPSPAQGASSYDRAREHFARHEKRLRQEDAVSDALIQHLRAETAPTARSERGPAQQIVRLVATDGMAGGRFVATNGRREPISLRFEASALSSASGHDLGLADVVFDPPTPTLLPGEATTIRLSLELPPSAEEGRSELRIDGIAGRDSALVLWVEIDAPLERGDGDGE